jgi:hypothetical protein
MGKYSVKKRKGGKSQTFKNRNKQVGGFMGFTNRGIIDAIKEDKGIRSAITRDKGIRTGMGNWWNRWREQVNEKKELKETITEAESNKKKKDEAVKVEEEKKKKIDEAVRKIIEYNTLIDEFNRLNQDKQELNAELTKQSVEGDTAKAKETSEKINSLNNELRTVLIKGKSISKNFITNMKAKIDAVLAKFTDPGDKTIINDRVAAAKTAATSNPPTSNPATSNHATSTSTAHNNYTAAFNKLHSHFHNVSIDDFKKYLVTYITESSKAAAAAGATANTAPPPPSTANTATGNPGANTAASLTAAAPTITPAGAPLTAITPAPAGAPLTPASPITTATTTTPPTSPSGAASLTAAATSAATSGAASGAASLTADPPTSPTTITPPTSPSGAAQNMIRTRTEDEDEDNSSSSSDSDEDDDDSDEDESYDGFLQEIDDQTHNLSEIIKNFEDDEPKRQSKQTVISGRDPDSGGQEYGPFQSGTGGNIKYYIKTTRSGSGMDKPDIYLNNKGDQVTLKSQVTSDLQPILPEHLETVKIADKGENVYKVDKRIDFEGDGEGRFKYIINNEVDGKKEFFDYEVEPAEPVVAGGSKKGRNKTLKKRNKK